MNPEQIAGAVEAQRVAQSTFRLKDWKQNLEALISPEDLEALLNAQEWQPIETAPKDGRCVLAINTDDGWDYGVLERGEAQQGQEDNSRGCIPVTTPPPIKRGHRRKPGMEWKMNNHSTGTIFAMVAFAVLVVGGAIWWQVYRYQDCKRVGHSTIYCIFSK